MAGGRFQRGWDQPWERLTAVLKVQRQASAVARSIRGR